MTAPAPTPRRTEPEHAGVLARLGSPERYSRERMELIIRRLADDLAPGADASRHVGGGNEYAESRPYQIGDPIRRLDWRQTARRGVPYTKQFEALRRMSVYVIVDASGSMRVTSGPISKLGAAAWLAAALGLVSLNRLSPVAVIGARPISQQGRPSANPDRFWHDVNPLLIGAANAAVPMRLALEHINATSRTTSLIIALSDFQNEHDAPALRHAACAHDVLAVQLIDPAELNFRRGGYIAAAEAETGRRFLSRPSAERAGPARVRESLSQSNIDTISVSTHADVVGEVRRALELRGLRSGRRA